MHRVAVTCVLLCDSMSPNDVTTDWLQRFCIPEEPNILVQLVHDDKIQALEENDMEHFVYLYLYESGYNAERLDHLVEDKSRRSDKR